MKYIVLLPFTAFIVNVFLSAYVYRENPRGKLNRIYAAFTAMIALWSSSAFSKLSAEEPIGALFWERTDAFFSIICVLLFFHFTAAFTGSRLASRKLMVPAYAVFFVAALLALTDLAISGMAPAPWGYSPIAGTLYMPILSLIFIVTFLSFLICAVFYLRSGPGKEKQQAKFMTAGFGAFIFFSVITEVVPYAGGPAVPPLTTSASTVLAAFAAYAIIRYRLMSLTPAIAAGSILDTMADYLVVSDGGGKVAFVSKSVLNSLGYRKDEVVGRPASVLFAGKEEEFSPIKERLSKDERVDNADAQVVTKKGEKIPVSVNATLISGAGETLGYVLLMRDMRETRKFIESLEEKRKLLEERTKELEGSKKKLETQMVESERLNKLAVGRELRMIELKKEIEKLRAGK